MYFSDFQKTLIKDITESKITNMFDFFEKYCGFEELAEPRPMCIRIQIHSVKEQDKKVVPLRKIEKYFAFKFDTVVINQIREFSSLLAALEKHKFLLIIQGNDDYTIEAFKPVKDLTSDEKNAVVLSMKYLNSIRSYVDYLKNKTIAPLPELINFINDSYMTYEEIGYLRNRDFMLKILKNSQRLLITTLIIVISALTINVILIFFGLNLINNKLKSTEEQSKPKLTSPINKNSSGTSTMIDSLKIK